MTALHYSMREGLKLLLGYKLVSKKLVCGFAGSSCKPLEALTVAEQAMLEDPASPLRVVEGDLQNIDYDDRARVILPGRNMHELAEALLARGADVNAAIKYPPAQVRLDYLPLLNLAGATPLLFAAASLDESAIEVLLEHGADPSRRTEVNHAVFSRQTREYADDNQVLGNGSPFLVAAGLGKRGRYTEDEEKRALAVTRRLLELGADVNEASATGWTALHAAAFNDAGDLVKLLVENGARLDARNGCGRTPLSMAAAENDVGLVARSRPKQNTVKLLQSLGASMAGESAPVGECVLGRYQYQPTEDQQ
jgi:ankyrin repeat protein